MQLGSYWEELGATGTMLEATGTRLRGTGIILGVTRSMLGAVWTRWVKHVGTRNCTEADWEWLWATGIMPEAIGRKWQ